MYFNDNKSNTNIDKQFEQENIFLRILNMPTKYKIFCIIAIAIIVIAIVIMVISFGNKKITNYLILNGEENINLYQGSDYIEPGYEAYNSKNEDLTSDVEIVSTLDTDKIGTYEITYTLNNITKTRKINIIEKPKEYTYIYLTVVNNNVDMYLKVGESYQEPGYMALNSTGKDITDKVTITGSVDTSKKGNYKLIYSVVDSNNVTVSVIRNVIIN